MPTTLAAVRSALWKHASKVPYASRTEADTAEVDALINQAADMLLLKGKWRGSTVRAQFSVYDGQITLPESLLTVLGFYPVVDGCCAGPGTVFSQWYDFIGSASSCCDCFTHMKDLGEGWPTFRDSPYTTFTIKVVSSHQGETASILLQGLDADGRQISRGSGAPGVSIGIRNTAETTTQVFSGLHRWVKSCRTRGIVRLYAVDTDTADEALLGYIIPGKVVSGYRRFRLPGFADAQVVECICKRAFVPAVCDEDEVIPANTEALRHAIRSLVFVAKDDDTRAVAALARAIQELDDERAEWDGDNQRLIVQFAGDYGAGSVPAIL